VPYGDADASAEEGEAEKEDAGVDAVHGESFLLVVMMVVAHCPVSAAPRWA
jgi:hypothetical protein